MGRGKCAKSVGLRPPEPTYIRANRSWNEWQGVWKDVAAMQNENEKPYTEVQKGINHVLKINGFCIAKFCFPRVQIKDHNNVSGNNRENWTYFDQLDAILGTRPSSAPVTLLQSGSSSAIIQSQEIDCKLYAFLSISLAHEYIIHMYSWWNTITTRFWWDLRWGVHSRWRYGVVV